MERTVPILGIIHEGSGDPKSFEPLVEAGFGGVIIRTVKRKDDTASTFAFDSKATHFMQLAHEAHLPYSSSGIPIPKLDPRGASKGLPNDISVFHQAEILHFVTVSATGMLPTLGYSADVEYEVTVTGCTDLEVAANTRVYGDALTNFGKLPIMQYHQDDWANARVLDAGIDFTDRLFRVADYRKIATYGKPPDDIREWDAWLAAITPAREREPDFLQNPPYAANIEADAWQFNCEVDGTRWGFAGAVCVNLMSQSGFMQWAGVRPPVVAPEVTITTGGFDYRVPVYQKGL